MSAERAMPTVARFPTALRIAAIWPIAPIVMPTETEAPTATSVCRLPSIPIATLAPKAAHTLSHARELTRTTAREASTA